MQEDLLADCDKPSKRSVQLCLLVDSSSLNLDTIVAHVLPDVSAKLLHTLAKSMYRQLQLASTGTQCHCNPSLHIAVHGLRNKAVTLP